MVRPPPPLPYRRPRGPSRRSETRGTRALIPTSPSLSLQLSPEELLATCQEAFVSFNPAQETLDAHADKFLAESRAKVRVMPRVRWRASRFHGDQRPPRRSEPPAPPP